MKEEVYEIKKKFEEIKIKGWIKSERKGPGGIGYTLEKLLGREENNLEIPDLINFELKGHRANSKSFITLFNATPDGDYLFEINRLHNTYGYVDKHSKNHKILNCDVNASELRNLGSHYKQIIKIDDQDKKIRLHILTNDLNLVEKEISWSFELLREKFERKMKFLVFIEADSKFINNDEYFKYKKITFYQAYSFDTFLELIRKGLIKITFKIGVFKSGKRIGQTHDHGTSFSISKENLEMLFYKI